MNENLKNRLRSKKIVRSIIRAKNNREIGKLYRFEKKNYKKQYGKGNPDGAAKYVLLLHTHVLEKGMSHDNLRRFGSKHVSILLDTLPLVRRDSFEYNYAFSTLNNYAKLYETQGWTDDENYRKVKATIDNGSKTNDVVESSIREALKPKECYKEFEKVLSSRHSVRSFEKKEISKADFTKAVDLARLTPTACNRQMCKVYLAKTPEKKAVLVKNIKGLSGFDIESTNLFIITYDQSSLLGPHERNQGFLNSGLFAMNFVNALHSLGIGSCLLQCGNSPKEENEIKQVLGINDNERIAVFIGAGYYLSSIKYLRSKRKSVENIGQII